MDKKLRRMQAEEALGDGERKFQAVFDSTLDPIFVIDNQGRFVDANPAAVKLTGLSREELATRSYEDFEACTTTGRLAGIWQRLLQQGQASGEVSFVDQDGQTRHLEYQAMINFMPGYHLAVLRDITERKKTEALLRLSDRILELVTSLIVIADRDGRVTYVNPAAREILGYEPQELLGDAWWSLSHADATAGTTEREAIARLARGEQTPNTEPYERKLVTRGGEVRSILWRDARAPDGLVIGTGQDITELKRAEEDRVAREAAEQANLAKNQFLSTMSHELRTPLNSVLGFGQLLAQDELTPDQQESVHYILKAGQHLLSLINEVLDIARIETGRLSLSVEPIDACEVLREGVDLIAPLAARREIRLSVDVPREQLGCFVSADRQRLKQVLLNLLSNAVKYNRDAGSVSAACYPVAGDRLRLEIADNGPGISPEKQRRLFVPFERLGAEHSGVEGTGLGLAMSKLLVETMGGNIGVESVPGQGSLFWIELDRVQESRVQLACKGTVPLGEQSGGEKPRTVLYIEDNPANLALMRRLIERRPGIKLVSSHSGLGIELAREHHIDLILLDLHLPDLAGDEALLRLKADPRTRDIPVVVLSAEANPLQIERALAEGAYTYLTKPLDVQQFFQLIDSLLKKWRLDV